MGSTTNTPIDLGTSGGDWLYRQGDLVLGPVPVAQLVDKLYGGEVDRATPVSRLGTSGFQPIGEIDFFRVHVAKAEAKHRVEASAEVEAARGRKSRNLWMGAIAAGGVTVAAIAAYGMRHVAVHGPIDEADEQAYAELISVEPPTITRARAGTENEELIEYPGGRPGVPSAKSPEKTARAETTPPHDAEKTRLASASRPEKAERKAARPSTETDESDGLQMAKFDQEGINAVVAAKQKTLFPCLTAEARKKPDLAAKIPIEFVIGNDGRVTKVWVDHPGFKEGALPECLLRELQKWKFKSYEGERATVGLSFKIGKG